MIFEIKVTPSFKLRLNVIRHNVLEHGILVHSLGIATSNIDDIR